MRQSSSRINALNHHPGVVLFFCLFIAGLFHSCSPKTVYILTPRIIPHQMSGFDRREPYRIDFTFDKTGEALRTFQEMLGDKAFSLLDIELYDSHFGSDLVNERVEIVGKVYLDYELDPVEPDSFFVIGGGEYNLLRKNKNISPLSGEFELLHNRFAVADLSNDSIEVCVSQTVFIHLPGQHRKYFDVNSVCFLIRLKTFHREERIFNIDYNAKHLVKYDGKVFGVLTFPSPAKDTDKLFQMSGEEMIIDYRKLLNRTK